MTSSARFPLAGILLACFATVPLAACHRAAAQKGRPPTPVRVSAATRIDAPVTLAASGVVEPVQTVAVTAQVSGVLQRVAFNEGDYVRAGQVLFLIDPRPLQAVVAQAGANLARDQAQAEAGRRNDARYAELAGLGYVARADADQVHATALAQAATVAADRAALHAAELNLAYATIRAPIEGRTGNLLVRQGNVVSPGSGPLVVINQIRPVRVRFPVLQQDFQTLRDAVAAHPLDVTAQPADSSRALEFGQLSFLDNAVDSLTGTVTGKALFPNLATRLWPGELVFLTLNVTVLHGVLAVPTSAVQLGQQGSYVYVVDPQKTAQMRPIVPGQATTDYTVVVSGLTPGEQVVVDGQSRLNPGARVVVVPTRGAGPREVAGTGGAAGGGLLPGQAGPPGSATATSATGGRTGAGTAGAGAAGAAAGGYAGAAAAAGGSSAGGTGANGAAAGSRPGAQTPAGATQATPTAPAPANGSAAATAPATTMPAPGVPPPSATPPPTTRPPATSGAPGTPTTPGGGTAPSTGGSARPGTGPGGTGTPAGSGAPSGAASPASSAGPGHL